MEWRLFADLAETVGDRRVTVEPAEDATVADALTALIEAEPALEELVYDGDELADHLTILRNGRNVATEADGLATRVEVGDELALFPPVSGG